MTEGPHLCWGVLGQPAGVLSGLAAAALQLSSSWVSAPSYTYPQGVALGDVPQAELHPRGCFSMPLT